jgi:hypothetical protein
MVLPTVLLDFACFSFARDKPLERLGSKGARLKSDSSIFHSLYLASPAFGTVNVVRTHIFLTSLFVWLAEARAMKILPWPFVFRVHAHFIVVNIPSNFFENRQRCIVKLVQAFPVPRVQTLFLVSTHDSLLSPA